MKHLPILDRSLRVIFHALMVGSIYLLFAGHNQPGGGFVGGLVAGSSVALHYVAGGIAEVRELSRLPPWTILGAGLLLAASTAALPVVLGDAAFTSSLLEGDIPLLGHVKISSTLLFDVGVYVLVVGLVLMVFEAFGDDPEVLADQQEAGQ